MTMTMNRPSDHYEVEQQKLFHMPEESISSEQLLEQIKQNAPLFDRLKERLQLKLEISDMEIQNIARSVLDGTYKWKNV